MAELQYFYPSQAHIINSEIEKQQPSSKLVNRYISSAVQYLNRTKSFHLPTTNTNNNNIPQHYMCNNNLAQSTSNNMENTNAILDSNNNNNSIDENKPQGIVNTLRRSLRKNKERFYNKRSATMKSCHSLNTYEQTTNDHGKIPTTPTLTYRRQTLANNIESCLLRNVTIDDNNNDEEMRKKISRTIISSFVF